MESRPPATPRTTVVEEPLTVPETVPETTIAPPLPPPQLGKAMRSAVEVEVDAHHHGRVPRAEAPQAPTDSGNQALEAILAVLTVSLLAGGFWSARRYA